MPSAALRIAASNPLTNRASSFSSSSLDYQILPSSARFLSDLTSTSNGTLSVSHTLDSASKRNAAVRTICSAGTYTYVRDASETHSHAKEEKIGVLLLNLGGPETLHDVQPFLFNLFADPDIIRLPRPFRFLQRPLAKLISVLRAPKSKEGYAAIGGGSPLRKLTDEQANALKTALEEKDFPVNVYVGMRYWYPFTEEAIEQRDIEKFAKPGEALIFFSAHGVPASYIMDGDPYKDQMEECIHLIMQELKSRGVHNGHTLAYQSRIGPVQWLKPYTDEVLVELGQKGVKSLLAVPVSFVSEHIETLEEIDMEYRELALESGIQNWGRVPALGCTPSFITDLADAVIEAVPSAAAMTTSTFNAENDETNPINYAIKMFFGSILAFVFLLSPKMLMAFRNQLF